MGYHFVGGNHAPSERPFVVSDGMQAEHGQHLVQLVIANLKGNRRAVLAEQLGHAASLARFKKTARQEVASKGLFTDERF